MTLSRIKLIKKLHMATIFRTAGPALSWLKRLGPEISFRILYLVGLPPREPI
jgi:hypothetical protein